jgi:DnaJ-domain-containing protein 1
VRIRLADGKSLNGKLLLRSGKAVGDALNSSQPFLEFETQANERSYIAKAQVASVMVAEIPAAATLDASSSEASAPHAILGVEPGAGPAAIRQAYLRITKKYHPDRFASIDLPEEVRTYLEAMARRINAAYAILQDEVEPV